MMQGLRQRCQSAPWRPICRARNSVAHMTAYRISAAGGCCRQMVPIALHKTVAALPRGNVLMLARDCACRPSGRRTRHCRAGSHGQIRRTGHDQEIRQPAALQHRHQHLCDARRPRHDGEERRGFRGLRRQDRRGHHPLGAGPDHLRAGEQGRRRTCCRSPSCASSSASTATACRCWCRAISKSRSTRSPASRRSSASRWPRPSARRRFGPLRGAGAPEHGDVRAHLRDVRAVRAARAQAATTAQRRSRDSRQPTSSGEIDELKRQMKRCRSGSTVSSDKDKTD